MLAADFILKGKETIGNRWVCNMEMVILTFTVIFSSAWPYSQTLLTRKSFFLLFLNIVSGFVQEYQSEGIYVRHFKIGIV